MILSPARASDIVNNGVWCPSVRCTFAERVKGYSSLFSLAPQYLYLLSAALLNTPGIIEPQLSHLQQRCFGVIGMRHVRATAGPVCCPETHWLPCQPPSPLLMVISR